MPGAKISMPSIEELWTALRAGGVSSQRLIDVSHPHDLYAGFALPDEVGMVVICAERPPLPRPLRAMTVEAGRREDGRWALRLALQEPALQPVFAAFCNDIVKFTSLNVDETQLGAAVLSRLQRWRSLLERDATGLDERILRGLIGELTVLRSRLLPMLGPKAAVAAWQGPYGAAQDFLLPDGHRIEVKASNWSASDVQINGLLQLDPGPDQLTLAVVRMQTTGALAQAATNAPRLISRLHALLADDADALGDFNYALGLLGWHNHPSHDKFAVRLMSIEAHMVSETFPRLTSASVPEGVVDVTYRVILPEIGVERWELLDD